MDSQQQSGGALTSQTTTRVLLRSNRSVRENTLQSQRSGLAQRQQQPQCSVAHIEALRVVMWLLGITIVIGGQYIGWNTGMDHGLYVNFVCFLLMSIAYITLCLCTAEISGVLPFAGGAYGLARCTLGFYPGFLIGCCETIKYVAYVATSVVLLSDLVIETIPSLKGLEPLIWFGFYSSALVFHIKGGRVFWSFNAVLGIVSIVILLIYCLGSVGAGYVDYDKNARQPNTNDFQNGLVGFMEILPTAVWFYVGIESLNLASDQIQEPKRVIPVAQVSCVFTLFFTGLMVFFVTVSLPPGLSSLSGMVSPLDNGFMLLFHLSSRSAKFLSLPATYATAFGFMWCYGKLIASMAKSKLLPPWLAKTPKSTDAPFAAVIAGSLVGYGLCVLQHYVKSVGNYLFTLCAMNAFMAYTGQCIGYISLKTKYKSIRGSSLSNPLGVYGAVVSMCIWIVDFIAVGFFQGHQEYLVFVVTVLLVTLYYHGYAKKRQTLSEEENRVLLVAHITKFNRRRSSKSSQSKLIVASGNGNNKTSGTIGTNRTSSFNGTATDKASVNRSHGQIQDGVEVMGPKLLSQASRKHTTVYISPG